MDSTDMKTSLGELGERDQAIQHGNGEARWELRVHASPGEVDAARWNALLHDSGHPTLFMRHEWLQALHQTGCASTEIGWTPAFLTLAHADQPDDMQAACPLYFKTHSYGEYVFDWSWADAYRRSGLRYYPKALCAVPFTPVPGSRLLARSHAARVALLQGVQQLAQAQGLSSAHVLFLDEADRDAAQALGWQLREAVQFHWTNLPDGYAGFDGFLASLQRDKRKKIQQERRKVDEAGVVVQSRVGREITESDWDFFYRCYVQTYREHHSQPYLSREFFAQVARTLPDHWLLFTATRGAEVVGCSLVALDPDRRVAYGRYWGATEWVPCLHFELCYYQPLAWCIEHAYQRFEGGAQGEHKMARGLLPVRTWSAHWLSHPEFADAVADFLARESQGIATYVNELTERNPFKPGEAEPG
jgi:predicted N-acyltransferase